MWERLGWVRAVARYAVLVELSEQPKCGASIFNAVTQLEDRLGLTPMSMLRLRWEIEDEQIADVSPIKRAPRLKVVAQEFGGV